MKIRLVTQHNPDSGAPQRRFLVRSHTNVGAERFIQKKLGRFIEAKVPTQEELVAAMQEGIRIEDATGAGVDIPPGPAEPGDTTDPTDSE